MPDTLLTKTPPPIAADFRRTLALRHRELRGRAADGRGPQAGTTTAEYAIGTLVILGDC